MGAQGVATINFGAFPGASDAYVDVTGQTGYTSANVAEAWLNPIDTADHLADEHLVETLKVVAKFISNGTLRIYGFNTNQLNEPLMPSRGHTTGGLAGASSVGQGFQQPLRGGRGTTIWGIWSVAWVWNVLVISFYFDRWF